MQKLNLKLTLRFLYIGFKGLALLRKGRSNLFEFIVMLEDFDHRLNFSKDAPPASLLRHLNLQFFRICSGNVIYV